MKGYHDIVGDGGSNVVAQVLEQKRAVDAALSEVRHVVAVASGKGGVGKSTLAMALAWCLRRQGAEVAILDADFNGPCQAQLAGLSGRPWVPGSSGLVMPRRADGIGVVSTGGVLAAQEPVRFASVARGDEHTWRATREFAILGQLLAAVEWGQLDLLLCDLPPGADRASHYAQFFGPRASFVLVTIPSLLAREVVARSHQALEDADTPLLGYIENMAGYACRGCGEVQPLFPPGMPLDLPQLGSVPFDPSLAARCDEGWADAEPDGAALAAIDAIARRLALTLEGDPA